MPLHLDALALDAPDPGVPAAFWAALLGREAVEEAGGIMVPGEDSQLGLRFVAAESETSGRELHLHLTSSSLEDQQLSVERALEPGGRHIDVGQLPEEGHMVLADPAGNKLCVIEPGNNFLAGCGYLAEVACDGAREVGVFWSAALDWPLNWDRDDETSINAPQGGTKISWGGGPAAPKHGMNRQRFDLVADDLDAEVDRLVGLGATRLDDRDGMVELADPDGNELLVRPGPR
jgi:Glyoxalase-like domain